MAQACQDDGCSVETVSNLLDQLKAKKTELQVRSSTEQQYRAVPATDQTTLYSPSPLVSIKVPSKLVLYLHDTIVPGEHCWPFCLAVPVRCLAAVNGREGGSRMSNA